MVRLVASELMDDPQVDGAQLARNFDDIERANRWFGGVEPVLRAVFERSAERVLDVGCGSADIPRALVREARRRGRRLEVTGLDRSQTVLEIARRRSGNDPFLHFVCGEGNALPFADASFDLTTCNLALHHFEPPEAIALLRELRRVARLTPLVCDLRRSPLGFAAAAAYAALFATSPLTRHDAPLSVRRAYTPREALQLARLAGWRTPQVSASPFWRMLVCDAE